MQSPEMTQNEKVFRFGIAGWLYPDWNGYVYESTQKNKLHFVANFVDVIEINNTFYKQPDSKTIETWINQIKDLDNKKFTIKLHQSITHEEYFDKNKVIKFKEGIMPLIETNLLTHILAQLPPWFDFTPKQCQRLQQISESIQITDKIPIVFELRHDSWNTPEAISYLKKIKAIIAAIDSPVMDSTFIPPCELMGTNPYLRLHGRNKDAWFNKNAGRDNVYNYLYNQREIESLANTLLTLAGNANTVTLIANNHYKGKELVNTLELKARITGKRVRIPPLLITKYPHLKDICENEINEQQNLF